MKAISGIPYKIIIHQDFFLSRIFSICQTFCWMSCLQTCSAVGCLKPATKVCNRCLDEKYCSKKCQVATWPKHKLTCSAEVRLGCSKCGKGTGLFSKKSFEVGDILFVEKPILVVPNCINNTQLSTFLSKRVFPSLSDPIKEYVMNMYDQNAEDLSVQTLAGIFQTNAIPMGNTNTVIGCQPSAGIFSLACRVNHSCCANSVYRWDSVSKRERVIAQRKIEAGDEITFNYVQHYWTFSQRRSLLREKFGFECSCELCSQNKIELHGSDTRRKEMQELYNMIPIVAKTDILQALTMSTRVIDFLVQEKIDVPVNLHNAYYDAYQMARECSFSVPTFAKRAHAYLHYVCKYARLCGIYEMKRMAYQKKTFYRISTCKACWNLSVDELCPLVSQE